jgi:hypothetical protein
MSTANIERLTASVSRLLSLRPSERDLIYLIDSLDAGQLFSSCLSRAGGDSNYLNSVCGVSYNHPNGFAKIVLVDKTPAWALRLHIWRAPVPKHQNDIHNHCGYLVSRVIRGELINEIYEECERGSGDRYFLYEDVLERSVHKLSYVGMRSLIAKSSEVVSGGASYYLDGPVIHRTVPSRDFPLITLVLQGPKVSMTSLVYRSRRRELAEEVSTMCSKEFFIGLLEEAVRYG